MNAVLQILDAVVNSLWQAVAITAAVWLVLRFATRLNAATRHAIWWAALAVVLILPFAPRVVTAMRAHTEHTASPSPGRRAATPPSTEVAPPFIIRVEPNDTARWPLMIVAVWAAILLWRLTQIVRSYIFLRRMKARATISPFALPPIPRHASLLVSREVASPMAVGFLHPAVILPACLLNELTDAEREHVLLHEAAHLAGYDDWTNLAMRLLAGALALHPIAIWILRRIEREREIACDDWVVSKTGAARPYAESLAHLFELREAKRCDLLASGIFGRNSRLGDRIEILLRRNRTFSPSASAKGVAASTMALTALLLASSLAPRWIAFAQTPTRQSFEVAAIKPGDPTIQFGGLRIAPGGRFTTNSASLQMLIGFAYDVRNHQIAGGPNWLETAKFTIDAKAGSSVQIPPGLASNTPIRLMLQSLLANRFRLVVHQEAREQQVYELVVNRGGPKLRDATSSLHARQQGLRMGRGEFTGTASPLSLLVNQLSQQLGRTVIDKTGLTGTYDFTLKWTPDAGTQAPDSATAEQSGPSIFTAVQEQLGLKLQSAKGPVEMIVIDHVEKPDAN
jgi:bla regulator protein BlaR1